jgi:Tol biopolymer transport system component
MALERGTQLGVYEVAEPIGAGGMGEVYRARDPRLGRDVAVKVLPVAFSTDPGRLARFEHEARAAAALNHPNILAVYDIGRLDASPYIVSELLEGETLRERMGATATSADALPMRKAIDYAIQLARGLAAAHDKGIVHRDLKPENVFITTDGRVKILDFGLAKLTESEPAAAADLVTQSNTDPGLVLGTVGYMSPEQVRGAAADHRSDIFSFGVVLYEMLSGRRAFRRDSSVETMTAILKEDPPEIGERGPPPALTRIVNRCLEKAPAARFQSTHDLAFALEALSSQSGAAESIHVKERATIGRSNRERVAWALVAVLGVGLAAALVGAALIYFRPGPSAETTRFFVTPPEGWALAQQAAQGDIAAAGPLAVSPDGRRVAFVARDQDGHTLIWVRSLDTLDARGLAGTEGGVSPFWSPDGRSLGFFADSKLKRVDISGGPPVTLCDTSPGLSGTWSPAGVIVFSTAAGTALQRVSASVGGAPTAATELTGNETGHARPLFLPDGRHFVYRATVGLETRGTAYVASLDPSERIKVAEVDSTNVVYSQGHLLFLRESTLIALRFDVDRIATRGEPFPVAERIQRFGVLPYGFFSASANGVLAYQTGEETAAPQLTWLNRTGRTIATIGEPAFYGDLALSPDGKHAAVTLLNSDIWLLDLERNGLATRLTFCPSINVLPLWSPDSSRVAFASSRQGTYDLYEKASSGAGSEQELLAGDANQLPVDWSPDGRFLLYVQARRGLGLGASLQGSNGDLWILPLSGDRKSFPFCLARGRPRDLLRVARPGLDADGGSRQGPRRRVRGRRGHAAVQGRPARHAPLVLSSVSRWPAVSGERPTGHRRHARADHRRPELDCGEVTELSNC